MNEQKNVACVQAMYAAFQKDDVATILSHLSDKVSWYSHLESIIPWSGDFSGKTNVPRFFEAINNAVEVEGFDPAEFIAQGNKVVSLGDFACTVRSTGKRSRTRWVFIWTFSEGKVVSYEQFHDAAMAATFKK